MVSRCSRAAVAILVLSLGVGVACAARTLSVPGEYVSIAAALDAAAAGDEIAVAPGIYTENLVVRIAVAIRGSGPDCTATILRGATPHLPTAFVFLAASGAVRFENLTLVTSGLSPCIGVSDSMDGLLAVIDCALTVEQGNAARAIDARGGVLAVDSSVFRGPNRDLRSHGGSDGVFLGPMASATIRNCDFAYFTHAIQAQGATSLAIEGNRIVYSTSGITISNQFYDSTTARISANQVHGCSVGIVISGAVTSIMIQGNTISDSRWAPFRVSAGPCFGADLGVPFSGTLFGTGNVVPQLDLLCPDAGSGFWPAGFFE